MEGGHPDKLLTDEIQEKNVILYRYPSDEEMEHAKLRLIYLGYYMPDWSGRNNAEFSIKSGLKVRTETPDLIGDLWGFSCLDEDYSIVNQFFKYLKLGFGRVTDQVCEAISCGDMTREEGLRLVKLYDGKCDQSFIKRFCHYLEISEEKFWEVTEKFRNQDIWKLDQDAQWQLLKEE